MPTRKQPAPKGYRQTGSVIVDPGGSWGALLEAGSLVRFIDLEGQQAVDFLCYNARDTRDRYNAANTMKMSENVYIDAGTVLYGESGKKGERAAPGTARRRTFSVLMCGIAAPRSKVKSI